MPKSPASRSAAVEPFPDQPPGPLAHLVVVSLCDRTGNAVRPWAEAGYTCYAVDIQHSIRKDRREWVGTNGGSIWFVWGDVRSWSPPLQPDQRLVFFFGFTPCTQLAVSGARDFKKKAWPMLRDGMDLFHSAYIAAQWAGCPYLLENPVGRIAGIYGHNEHVFSPWEFTSLCPEDNYLKETCLWAGGGLVMPAIAPLSKVAAAVELVRETTKRSKLITKANARELLPGNQFIEEWYPDDRIHLASPDDDRGDVRSATPMGFARAIFLANAPHLREQTIAA